MKKSILLVSLAMGSWGAFAQHDHNNDGAYWLSNKMAIANPYFGDKMPTCGSVKETIN